MNKSKFVTHRYIDCKDCGKETIHGSARITYDGMVCSKCYRERQKTIIIEKYNKTSFECEECDTKLYLKITRIKKYNDKILCPKCFRKHIENACIRRVRYD